MHRANQCNQLIAFGRGFARYAPRDTPRVSRTQLRQASKGVLRKAPLGAFVCPHIAVIAPSASRSS